MGRRAVVNRLFDVYMVYAATFTMYWTGMQK